MAGSWKRPGGLPEVKHVQGTPFIVDGFAWGPLPGWCTAAFLSHFHSDHYQGLGKRYAGPTIYCSHATANLAISRLKVDPALIKALDIGTDYHIDGLRVRVLDANHCPGSLMFVFWTVCGRTILHTGDCRAGPQLVEHLDLYCPLLFFDSIYLDTTYCDPDYAFPSQDRIIDECCMTVRGLLSDRGRLAPVKRVVVVGTYLIGKERIAMALARELGSGLYAERTKLDTLKRLEWPELSSLLVSEKSEARVWFAQLSQVTVEGLQDILDKNPWIGQVVGVRPTGWTFSPASPKAEVKVKVRTYDGRGKKRQAMAILDVPYSEHSSFSELQSLLGSVCFARVVPTVSNDGNPHRSLQLSDYDTLDALLKAWGQQAGVGRGSGHW